MSNSQAFLFFLLLLGSIAVALRLISRNTELIPYQVVLAAAGVGLGFIPGLPIPHVGPDLILLAFVPALVFEAAIGLDLDELWRRLLPVTLLATVGVVLTVLGVGLVVHLVLGLTWAAGFLIGAIVAATDPIAVVSLLRRLDAPAGLGAILEGESLFNDGTGVALFSAVLATIVSGSPSLTDAAVRFVLLTAGGAAIGVLIGLGAVAVLRTAREAELEILVTLVAAYGSYLTADVLHVSGVVAVVGAAIVVARFGSRTGRLRGTQLQGFWALLGFVLNAILFMLVGAALPSREAAGLGAARRWRLPHDDPGPNRAGIPASGIVRPQGTPHPLALAASRALGWHTRCPRRRASAGRRGPAGGGSARFGCGIRDDHPFFVRTRRYPSADCPAFGIGGDRKPLR